MDLFGEVMIKLKQGRKNIRNTKTFKKGNLPTQTDIWISIHTTK